MFPSPSNAPRTLTHARFVTPHKSQVLRVLTIFDSEAPYIHSKCDFGPCQWMNIVWGIVYLHPLASKTQMFMSCSWFTDTLPCKISSIHLQFCLSCGDYNDKLNYLLLCVRCLYLVIAPFKILFLCHIFTQMFLISACRRVICSYAALPQLAAT